MSVLCRFLKVSWLVGKLARLLPQPETNHWGNKKHEPQTFPDIPRRCLKIMDIALG
ncbi:hypothetical protein K449DRAFT_382080 [Hypoxylon sp. EC38]|nr:hypothetical protein K449DRAFT_382080 [Hypoxylon sp. EC38]